LTIYDIVTKWSLPRKSISSMYDMILLKSRNKNQLLLVMCDFQRVNLICLMSFLNISILIHENKKKIMWKGVCIKKKKLNDCVWFYWDFFSLW
jgi:hypothetical protein